MQTRIVQIGAAIAAIVLALMLARAQAFAASDHESCSTTHTDVTNANTDGTTAECDAAATSKAKAKASDKGTAESFAEDDGAKADSSASDGAFADADAASGDATSNARGLDSEADSFINQSGRGRQSHFDHHRRRFRRRAY